MNRVGFIKWFADGIATHMLGLSPRLAMIILLVVFFVAHYLFARVDAYTFQSRLLVFFPWAVQDLTFSRGARLITGVAPTDFNFDEELSELRTSPEIKAEPTATSALNPESERIARNRELRVDDVVLLSPDHSASRACLPFRFRSAIGAASFSSARLGL